MKLIYLAVTLIVALATACSTSKAPSFQAPTFPDVLKGLKTCTKKESDQTVSPQARANVITLSAKVENQDIENIDCDGKVISKTHGPVHNVIQLVKLPAPTGVTGNIKWVEIENQRTCSISRVNAEDDSLWQENLALPNGKKLQLLPGFTKAGVSGRIQLVMTDSDFKLLEETNIIDGANVLTVKYFGDCQIYRKDRDEKLGESYNCIKADPIAAQDLTIQLNVDRPEVGGTHQNHACSHLPNSN